MSNKALTTVPALALDTAGMDVMSLGTVFAKSGYFKDARDASQAVVKILYGQEIGIGPVSSMMGVHIIEGKPAPSANLIAARIKNSGRYNYRVREHTAEVCRIEFYERVGNAWDPMGVVEWSLEDAKRAGLAGRGTWARYPRALLFARAISEGARVHTPEIFGGAPVYTPEELGAEVDADGNAVGLVAPVAGVEEAEAVELQFPSERQAIFIRNLINSHVFTPEERELVEKRLENGFKGSVSEAIDRIQKQMAERKAAEKAAQDEYLDEILAATDPDGEEAPAELWQEDEP